MLLYLYIKNNIDSMLSYISQNQSKKNGKRIHKDLNLYVLAKNFLSYWSVLIVEKMV